MMEESKMVEKMEISDEVIGEVKSRAGLKKRDYATPYGDPHSKDHRFHAVVESSYGGTQFLSAATKEALNESLSELTQIKRIYAIYEGQLLDFAEKRTVIFGS